MNRFVMSLALFVLGTLLLAPAATADKPVRSFLPADDFSISGVCPFEVEVDVLMNNEFQTVFSDGRTLITGTLKFEFTNVDEPDKSLQANVSGPGLITPTPDGGIVLKAQGPWFWFFFPGDLGSGSPGTALLTKGLTVLVIDGSGNLTFTPARNSTDLCAMLG